MSTGVGDQSNPDVTWNGSHYVVVWDDNRVGSSYNVYATRLTSTGTVLSPNLIPISTGSSDETNPAVAASGTDVLVIWEDRRNGAESDLYAARTDDAGTVRDPGGFAFSTQPGDEANPAAVTISDNKVAASYERYAAATPYRANRVFFRTSPK